MTTKIYRFPLFVFFPPTFIIFPLSVFKNKKKFHFFPYPFRVAIFTHTKQSAHIPSIYIFVGNYSSDAVVVEAALTLILCSFRFLAVHSFDQIGIMCESDWLWLCSWFSLSFFLSLFFSFLVHLLLHEILLYFFPRTFDFCFVSNFSSFSRKIRHKMEFMHGTPFVWDMDRIASPLQCHIFDFYGKARAQHRTKITELWFIFGKHPRHVFRSKMRSFGKR